jgi:oxygen-independent coproporphyrinogen-3 oxidase
MNPVSLYINFPFCKSKCYHCDYTTVIYNKEYAEKYVNCIIKELLLYKQYKIKTIYFGGGTPSLFENCLLKKILNVLTRFKLCSDFEFTIECNPDNITENKLEFYKNNNVNRISIGAVSFNNTILNFFNRNYNSKVLINSINLTKKYFNNFNLDLIFGIPKPYAFNILQDDIKQILFYKPKHIAIYDLQIEPKSYFYWLYKNKKIIPVNDYEYEKEYKYINETLIKNNYHHYEISSYCIPNFESKHNSSYWQNKNYIGIGAGSHSYINNKRYYNYKFPKKYINAIENNFNPIEHEEFIDNKTLFKEIVMLNLHLSSGLNIDYINKKFNINFLDKYNNIIDKHIKNNLIFIDNNKVKLTFKGKLLSNTVISDFF